MLLIPRRLAQGRCLEARNNQELEPTKQVPAGGLSPDAHTEERLRYNFNLRPAEVVRFPQPPASTRPAAYACRGRSATACQQAGIGVWSRCMETRSKISDMGFGGRWFGWVVDANPPPPGWWFRAGWVSPRRFPLFLSQIRDVFFCGLKIETGNWVSRAPLLKELVGRRVPTA